jgi:hypothetical protein
MGRLKVTSGIITKCDHHNPTVGSSQWDHHTSLKMCSGIITHDGLGGGGLGGRGEVGVVAGVSGKTPECKKQLLRPMRVMSSYPFILTGKRTVGTQNLKKSFLNDLK